MVLLNSEKPYSKETQQLAEEIAAKNEVLVLPINCAQLKKEEINKILETVLHEFLISTISFYMPKWVEMLDEEHYFKKSIIESIKGVISAMKSVKDTLHLQDIASEFIRNSKIDKKDLSTGNIDVNLTMDDKHYYSVLSNLTGMEIDNEYKLINALMDYSKLKYDYGKIENAMANVNFRGYGVVTPSIHMIKTQVLTEIAPIVGNEEQAKDLIVYIKTNGEESENGIFETNIFGKSIEQIVEEGIKNKLEKLSNETQDKLKDTLEKITNESNGGVICIII